MSRSAVVAWCSRAVTFLIVVAFVGMLPFLSGGDPAASVLRARSAEQLATEEALEAVRADLGLGESAWGTLGLWLRGVLTGDLGSSWVSGAAVGPSVVSALGTSAVLALAAVVVMSLVAAALCLGAVRSGARGRPSAGSGLAGASLTALPEFVLGAVLLLVFSVALGWLPPYGWGEARHLVLPALALGLPAGGLLGRLLAEAVAGAYRETWVQTWTMSGWSPGQILRAVLRRALPALLPQIGLILVGLTGGAVAVEQIFAVPGLGRTALGAAASSDLPLLQACVMLLLLLGAAAGASMKALGGWLLGSAARAEALTAAEAPLAVRRGWWVVPGLCAAALAATIVAGAGRDAYGIRLPRLGTPGTTGDDGALAWWGADALGRDVLARVGQGAATTIALALLCVLGGWLIGLAAGLLPALSAGPAEAANAVPPVLAGLLVAAVIGPSAWGATVAVLAVSWAPLAAHTAALVREGLAAPYARMAPLLGVSRTRLLLRAVLPGTAATVFRHAMLRLPGTALALAALGFLGLGPQPPAPDWGLQLADGIGYLERAPWVAGFPLLALVALSVLAVSLSSRRV